MTSSNKRLEVQTEDQTPHKWCVSLGEEPFKRFFSQTNPTVHKVFGDGSLFSPLLFGKFFDPSDAFPLWEFESDVLLSHLRSSSQSTVDWCQTAEGYILKAEKPGTGKNNIQVVVDKGKVVEISGPWKQQRDSKAHDWRCGHWWEHGYVRRLEMPEDADWKNIEAYIHNDIYLEIRIPKSKQGRDLPQGKDVA
ncbi:21.7 kDa class VI heat shock protein-like isoform X2 [Vigna umbellata]|uniref:21.7 kDa class VI heat shock protein-like isoform X2 n=1 Tax=Vigna umbellata TaxID=87088 RepID=UPI001F5ED9B6|nr:21.7 kDa class VI heat shock protein-like isoform X2 [Vigna umbellata]